MAGGYEKALLNADEAADVQSPRKKFYGKQLLALLLGASCLWGVSFFAYVSAPRMTQVDKETNLNVKDSGKYYWPAVRGPVGSTLASPYAAAFDIKKPTWTWNYNCCLFCDSCTMALGTAIDGQKNIYYSAADGIRKFTSDGRLLWYYRPGSDVFSKAAAIMDGRVYAISEQANTFALSMDTGRLLWSVKVSEKGSDGNYGGIIAHQGVVVVAAELVLETMGPVNSKLYGLNSTDGSLIWTFKPDVAVWNYGGSIADDGTFVFEDFSAKVHRMVVSDGTLVWKSGGVPGTWTDGQASLGLHGIVYGVGLYPDFVTGHLTAHSFNDGKILWRQNISTLTNSIAAVGMLAGQTNLSVVLPVGRQCTKGQPIDVHAFDALTGEQQWVFKGPTQTVSSGLGDARNSVRFQRLFNRITPLDMPNPWGTPVIDGEGSVLVGGITGHFFRLRDLNRDGVVSGPEEAEYLLTDEDWVGSSSLAIAPGLAVTGNAKSLIAWTF